ncbi:Sulfiredoxin, chloroplastic/mitochondrial [Linum perenne]
MANLILRVPATNLRGFSVKAASSSSSNAGPMIVEIPLDQIKRPLMRTRTNDQDKVQDLMHSIHQIGLQVPVRAFDSQFLSVFEFVCYSWILIFRILLQIDVLEVDGVYYGTQLLRV